MSQVIDLRKRRQITYKRKKSASVEVKKEPAFAKSFGEVKQAKKELPEVSFLPIPEEFPLEEATLAPAFPSSSHQLEWAFIPHEHQHRTKHGWKFFLGFLFAGGIAFLFLKNFLIAIFLILTGVVLILSRDSAKKSVSVRIDGVGLELDDNFFEYSKMKSFWLDYMPGGIKEISFELKQWQSPYLKIPMEDQDPIELRALLIQYLPEKPHEHSLIHVIARRLI